MSDLDERVRAELHRHSAPVAGAPDSTDLLGDVSQRLHVLRRHRRARRRRLLVAICALVVAAGIATGVGVSQTTKAPSGHGTIIDPRAGKGGFTISPTQHLRNDQHVTVRIHGLESAENVLVLMCAGVPHTFAAGQNVCSAATELNTVSNVKGSANVKYTVKRVITIGWDYQIDCATYPPRLFNRRGRSRQCLRKRWNREHRARYLHYWPSAPAQQGIDLCLASSTVQGWRRSDRQRTGVPRERRGEGGGMSDQS